MIKHTILFLLMSMSLPVLSQGQDNSTADTDDGSPAKYFNVSIGLASSKFRDFGTSPLFYKGAVKYASLSRLVSGKKREVETLLIYSGGNYVMAYNQHTAQSKVTTVIATHSRLYTLNRFTNEKWNVKAGGQFSVLGNLRINESLQNNALGKEILPTLYGSVKATKDLSTHEPRQKKFLFIKYKLKARPRELGFRFNAGLLNGSYRNGYAYASQGGVVDEFSLFDDYEFHLSGLRFGTVIDYTVWRENKNACRLSYVWDAYTTGSTPDKFEMAQHVLRFTLLFNTNNR
jgi:hypothetical protein